MDVIPSVSSASWRFLCDRCLWWGSVMLILRIRIVWYWRYLPCSLYQTCLVHDSGALRVHCSCHRWASLFEAVCAQRQWCLYTARKAANFAQIWRVHAWHCSIEASCGMNTFWLVRVNLLLPIRCSSLPWRIKIFGINRSANLGGLPFVWSTNLLYHIFESVLYNLLKHVVCMSASWGSLPFGW